MNAEIPFSPDCIGRELINRAFGFEIYAIDSTQLSIGLPFTLPIGLEQIFIQFTSDAIILTDLGSITEYLTEKPQHGQIALQNIKPLAEKYGLEQLTVDTIGKRISYRNEHGEEKSLDEIVGDVIDALFGLLRIYILIDAAENNASISVNN